LNCLNGKPNGRYEGSWVDGKKDGCGVFEWPHGQKTMEYHNHDELVRSEKFSVDVQVADLLQKEKEQWNIAKKEEEVLFRKQLEQWEKTKLQQMKVLEIELEEKKRAELAQLAEEKQQINFDRQTFEEEKRKMATISIPQGIVKLNIGGTLFTTSVSTLTKLPGSLFEAMFSGRYEMPKDDQGAVFLDRDGTHFRLILNYLLDGVLPPNMSEDVRHALLIEANYYQLASLVTASEK